MAEDRGNEYRLRKALFLADEDHEKSYSMDDQYTKSRRYCLYEDLKKKWGASDFVIKTWTIAGWDVRGFPIFSAYLGEQWEKEVYYDKNGYHVGFAGDDDCMEYPLSEFSLSSHDHVIALPEMRLCLKKGVRQRIREEIRSLEGNQTRGFFLDS